MLIRLELVGCLVISGAMAAGLSALLLHRVTNQIWISAVGASLTIGLAATQNTLKEYATDFLTSLSHCCGSRLLSRYLLFDGLRKPSLKAIFQMFRKVSRLTQNPFEQPFGNGIS